MTVTADQLATVPGKDEVVDDDWGPWEPRVFYRKRPGRVQYRLADDPQVFTLLSGDSFHLHIHAGNVSDQELQQRLDEF